jgi:hypothetical protein
VTSLESQIRCSKSSYVDASPQQVANPRPSSARTVDRFASSLLRSATLTVLRHFSKDRNCFRIHSLRFSFYLWRVTLIFALVRPDFILQERDKQKAETFTYKVCPHTSVATSDGLKHDFA